MLAVDLLPIFTGIIGVAGGVLAAIVSGVVARREGRDTRAHEREVLLWRSRADAYLLGLEYAARLHNWAWKIKNAALQADGVLGDMPEPPEDPWSTDGWHRAHAGLRAFATDEVSEAFAELEVTRQALGRFLFLNPDETVTEDEVAGRYEDLRGAFRAARTRIAAELQHSHRAVTRCLPRGAGAVAAVRAGAEPSGAAR
ncbi:MAG TPA: hypothetical protein VN796_12210 [Acidimicrobiales bacterium]|nr:hypothetical protein [Acidimicrobiales bacterium]